MLKILLFIGSFTALFSYLGLRLKAKDPVVTYAAVFSFFGIILSCIFQYGRQLVSVSLSKESTILLKDVLAKKQFTIVCFASCANLLTAIAFLIIAGRVIYLLHTYYFKQKLVHYTKNK